MNFAITRHAHSRMLERLTLPPDTDIKIARDMAHAMWAKGLPYGAQASRGQLRLCVCNRTGEKCVIACADIPGGLLMTTLMTEAEATNAQQPYIRYHQRKHAPTPSRKATRHSRGLQLKQRAKYRKKHWDDDDE